MVLVLVENELMVNAEMNREVKTPRMWDAEMVVVTEGAWMTL
jgi:hypothetical protein